MTTASPWHGLGSLNLRSSTKPAAPFDNKPDRAPFEHRTIPAAGAPSVLPANPIVSPFTHPFKPSDAGAQAPDDATADNNNEEKNMPQPAATAVKTRKPRPSKTASARFQLCALLLAKGDLTRDELKADVSADATAFTNAIFNAKAAGQIAFIARTDKWHLTQAGKDWTSASAKNHKAAAKAEPARRAKKTKPVPAKRARIGSKVRKASADSTTQSAAPGSALAVRPFEPVVERSFRCAVFNDGAFHLAKNGQAIDLTAAEFAEAVRYLDRMAEPTPT